MAKTFNLQFDGYWRDVNKGGLSKAAGIYVVYAGSFNTTEKTVSLRKILYIGEAGNINSRVASHEKRGDWERHLQSGEILCFSETLISIDRERAEAALINKLKPPVNTEYVKEFPFQTTIINSSGKHRFIPATFTING